MVIDTTMTETAVIYSNGNQECERMAMLLRSLPQISEFLEYRVDKHYSENAFYAEFGKEATFPQVAIGYKHIGSIKDTLNYLKNVNWIS